MEPAKNEPAPRTSLALKVLLTSRGVTLWRLRLGLWFGRIVDRLGGPVD